MEKPETKYLLQTDSETWRKLKVLCAQKQITIKDYLLLIIKDAIERDGEKNDK